MKILFLDDDKYRHEMFYSWIKQHPEKENLFTTHVYSYRDFTTITGSGLNENWDIMFLDHNLGVADQMCIPDITNRFPTGSDVARYMVENNIKAKKIVIHSYNSVGAGNMINIFKEMGMDAIYHPFDEKLKEHLC